MKTNEDLIIPINRKRQIRCTNKLTRGHRKGEICNRLFCVGELGSGGAVEYLCPRCKQMLRVMKIP